jgi:hypothetical protein
MDNKLVGISGGAFYLRAQAAALYTAKQCGFNPTHYIGTSSGAIISAVAAVLGIEKMWDFARKINPKQVILNNPLSKDGKYKIKTLFRIVAGCHPIKQSIIPILNTIISSADWDKWRYNSRVSCMVTTYNITEKRVCLWDLRKLDRDRAFIVLEASARLQGLCAPVDIDGAKHWDGGQLDHNPAHRVMIKGFCFNDALMIWSRPENWEPQTPKNSNFFSMLDFMIDADNCEKSYNDQLKIEDLAQDLDIKLKQVFIPRTLLHRYDNNEERLNKTVMAAVDATLQIF